MLHKKIKKKKVIPSPKEKALLLNSRKRVKYAIEFYLGFQYLLHLWNICYLDSIGYELHGHSNFSLGKNLSQYLPIGVWLTIALEALV